MDNNTIIIYLACIVVIFIVGRIFYLPLRRILKLLINSALGGILIYIINIVGASWGVHIGLNFVTAIFTGLLGVPGVIFLVILKLVL